MSNEIKSPSFFNEGTIEDLNGPISKDDVKTREGTGGQKLSYIPAFHAIQEANRIFGFGNWGTEIMMLKQVDRTEYEKPPYKAGDDPKPMISISYLCHLKLTISNGYIGKTSHEDTGFGNGVAGATAYGISSVTELATKEAVTDALKRCLRFYGNKFGLSLYDTDEYLQTPPEIQAAKVVTEEQLKTLRDLYPARDIDDGWVQVALQAENWDGDSLEGMRFDWYQLAFKITREYKLDEIEREWYERDLARVMELIEQSANMNMLKALFKEAWDKTQKYKDKEAQQKAVKLYEEMKLKFGEKK